MYDTLSVAQSGYECSCVFNLVEHSGRNREVHDSLVVVCM